MPLEPESPRLDAMSISLEKDKETSEYADYFFMCNVWARDPRYTNRWMIVGQRRGLFRIGKAGATPDLLWPMDMDGDGKCFSRAAAKIAALRQEQGAFPAKAQVAIG